MMCIAGYAMSAAPVVWILCSEIQPLKCRDFGITCSTTTNWVSGSDYGATFLTLLDSIGAAGCVLALHCAEHCVLGIAFWLIPETKNVTLEHIERKLMAGESKEISASDFTGRMCCTSGPFFR
ncbi:MFS transporter [Shigella flexneri]